MIALDYDWEESFEQLVDEEAYISAFFHLAHREYKNLAESLQKTQKPYKDEEFEPDTSWCENLLERSVEDIETESFYNLMSFTPESYRTETSYPEARISAEVKHIWEHLAHDLDFYTESNRKKLLSEETLYHLKDETVENRSDLI